MSYCVNCGVELDITASACPLCNTKVYNPNQPVATDVPTPYATVKGHSEPVKMKEFTILMTIILATATLVCFFLNYFTIQIGRWSFYAAGIFAMLWVFMLPAFFPRKISSALALLLDGIMIALNVGIISYLHPGDGWYFRIAIPLIVLAILLLVIIAIVFNRQKRSLIKRSALCVTEIAIFCLVTELVIDLYTKGYFYLRWSAIVASCAFVIDIVLLTIYLLDGLRSELRRRMHF